MTDWADVVRGELRRGVSVDDIGRTLLDRGLGPIETVKALRSGAGLGLDEAKVVVDGLLTPGQQAANERLRDTAMDALLDGAE
jgi:hypothetical protein